MYEYICIFLYSFYSNSCIGSRISRNFTLCNKVFIHSSYSNIYNGNLTKLHRRLGRHCCSFAQCMRNTWENSLSLLCDMNTASHNQSCIHMTPYVVWNELQQVCQYILGKAFHQLTPIPSHLPREGCQAILAQLSTPCKNDTSWLQKLGVKTQV